MRRFDIEKWVILHGQKVRIEKHIFEIDAKREDVEKATLAQLRELFEKFGSLIELPNAIFEKSAISGMYVNVIDITPLKMRILNRLKKIQIKWK